MSRISHVIFVALALGYILRHQIIHTLHVVKRQMCKTGKIHPLVNETGQLRQKYKILHNM